MTDDQAHSPIFYDPHRRRWWRWRVGFFLIAGILAIVMIVFLASIMSPPHLASLNLPYQTRGLRSAHEFSKLRISPARLRERRLGRMITRAKSPGKVAAAPGAGAPQAGAAAAEPLMFAFFVNWDTTSLTSFRRHFDKIDVFIPEWLETGNSGDGSLIIKDEEENALAVREIIKQAHPELKILPMLTNFDGQVWKSDLLARILAVPSARMRMVSEVAGYLKRNGFAGINVDFESLPSSSQADLRAFMRELYSSLHSQNLLVSQDLPAADTDFDYAFYAGVNDFVVLMAYDEHWSGSAPGPIASQDWFLSVVQDRLDEIPPDKLILALANYGYDWTELSEKRYRGKNISYQEVMRTASESEATPEFDPDALNPRFEFYDEANRLHHVWFLDGVTVYNQVAQTKQYYPRGYALWRLGSEDPTAWKVLADFDTRAQIAETMKPLSYGYDVDFNGEGELLRIEARPNPGQRDYTLDPKVNLITDESFRKIPLGYLMDRQGRSKNKMAITFDDGPDSAYTPRVLDILKQYHAPATFFLVGLEAQNNMGLVRRIVAEGHEIGNHTFSHPNIGDTSAAQMGIELNLTQRLFEAKLGRQSLFFRPPYGVDSEPETPDEVRPLEVAESMGYLMVGERPDSRDWYYLREPAKILEATLTQLSKGNVLLMHDAGGDRSATLQALPLIITVLRQRGYEIVPLSSLIGKTRDQVMPPTPDADIWRARLDNVAFSLFMLAGSAFQWLFFIGIVFGIGRFVFIGTLAVIQSILRHWERFNDAFTPFVSIIVPALNEERVIQRTIASLLRSDYPQFDVIVVDDGSSDRTAARVREAFGADPRVRLFVRENRGKAEALNFALLQSSSEIVIAVDADTLFEKDTIRKLVRHFEVAEVGAVAGNAKVGNRVNLLTRWQALEYIASQNLDRRAFDALNCITVVPGAVGAWRRDLILKAGGFTSQTLAEDTDLTISIRRLGYEIVYEDKAVAYTEAPDRLRGFLRQRFRWTYGILQSVYKHRDALFRGKYSSLGFVALPNVIIFQILFPLISPLIDLLTVTAIAVFELQRYYHGSTYSNAYLLRIALFYVMFLTVDYLTCILAFALERKEQWSLLLWVFWQRFLYRQVMYYVAVKSVLTALRGSAVAWVRVERKATVSLNQ